MDPELWGNLQYHIDLREQVYTKLPLREFLQLRGVCKEWNRVARAQLCLTDAIRKPYFVFAQREWYARYNPGFTFHGILTFHIASGRWRFNVLRPLYFSAVHEPFTVKGLVHSVDGASDMHCVDDPHSKKAYRIRYIPPVSGCPGALGMAVDASVVPHTFKIIIGHIDRETQIYDSVTQNWETRSSILDIPGPHSLPAIHFKSCLHFDDHVYIWSKLGTILVYSLKEDIWTQLHSPPRHEDERVGGTLGAWDGRVFIVMEDIGQLSVAVWELVDRPNHEWKSVARIPSEVHAWMVPPWFQIDSVIRVIANFCDQYVLMYTMMGEKDGQGRLTKRLVLLNLATKQWEKVEMGARRGVRGLNRDGRWDGSVDQFTEDRRRIVPVNPQ